MPRKRPNNHLEEALVLLINNQAAFLSRLGEVDGRFSRIERELADIKAILLRHEQMLQVLPEAIRQKIGFETR